jgi:hypothetical protein
LSANVARSDFSSLPRAQTFCKKTCLKQDRTVNSNQLQANALTEGLDAPKPLNAPSEHQMLVVESSQRLIVATINCFKKPTVES